MEAPLCVGLEIEVLRLVSDSVRNILRTLKATKPITSVGRLTYVKSLLTNILRANAGNRRNAGHGQTPEMQI